MLKKIPRSAWDLIVCLCLLLITLTIVKMTRMSGEQEAAAEVPARVTVETQLHTSIFYKPCGHTVTENPADSSAFVGADSEALASMGWRVEWREDGVYLYRESDDFCPTDAAKRHLRLYNRQLAVYAGPLGSDGELLEVLDIPLKSLPPRWLAQLTNGGIEFADEETLLMALDSVDEMIK